MMVGPSGSGKSMAWKALLKALERLEGVEGVAHVIDPKVYVQKCKPTFSLECYCGPGQDKNAHFLMKLVKFPIMILFTN